MIFMNRDDIQQACDRFDRHPILGSAARLLAEFQSEVDAHSDGWPYWSAPVRAAAQLQTLLHGHLRAGMGAYPHLPEPTHADVQKALRPLKAFMTRRGRAAGMEVVWP